MKIEGFEFFFFFSTDCNRPSKTPVNPDFSTQGWEEQGQFFPPRGL
jgi:hypothetical protein